MANAEHIIKVVEELGFPESEFAVFGGACLALRRIREARDLEVFVTDRVNDNLLCSEGWSQEDFAGGNQHLVGMILGLEVQVFSRWDSEGWQPKINSYIKEPEFVLDIPCMPIDELTAWKRATARPKDLRDLDLIEEWRRSQP